MIDPQNILLVTSAFAGVWVTGYSFGKAASWLRAIRGAV